MTAPGPSSGNGAHPPDDELLDLTKLRLPQNFADTIGVKKALLTVPVRKPTRQEFVRVHPEPTYRLQAAIIELKDDRESYLVVPELCAEIPGEVIPKLLLTTITRQGVVTLWPVTLPSEDGRTNEWHRSALQAAELAMQRWVRLGANMSLGAYECFQAAGPLGDPEWPEASFEEILRIAFRNKVVRSLDHPVLRRLRGEV